MKKLFPSKYILPLIGVMLIIVGLTYALRSGRRALDAYREIQFASDHDFDEGVPDIDLISSWMNIRYIAEAYTVPQSFIFDELGLEMTRPSSGIPIGQLNQRFEFGDNEVGEPAIVDRIKDAVLAYQENPVVTGLSEERVQPWMNVAYIANSTGIPVETFFIDLGLPVDGYAYIPLFRLSSEANYEPGVDQLIESLQQTVDAHTGVE